MADEIVPDDYFVSGESVETVGKMVDSNQKPKKQVILLLFDVFLFTSFEEKEEERQRKNRSSWFNSWRSF